MTADRPRPRSLTGRIAEQCRPYWPLFLLIALLNLLATPLALLGPLPLKLVVDHVLGDEPAPRWLLVALGREASALAAADRSAVLGFAAILMVAVGSLAYLNGLALWLLQTYTGEKLVLSFRSRLFRHVQRLSLAYHDTRGSSDSVYRIQYDAPAVQWIAIDGLLPLIASALTLAGMVAVMAWLSGLLALVALTVVPMLWVITHLAGRRLRETWDSVRQVESSAMGVVQETLGALRVVKAFGQEDRQQDQFTQRARAGLKGQLRVAAIRGGFDVLTGITLAGGSAAVLFIGVRQVRQQAMTLGELLVVLAYLAQLYGPLQTVTKKLTDIQGSLAGAARAFALIDQSPEVVQSPHARRLPRARGRVAFEQVAFAYGEQPPVFQNVNLDIPAGCRVGIVGRTGSGKTTLVSLLVRFFDPTRGRVTLDGIDLRGLRLDDLRAQYSLVLQEPVLFSTSIAENIAYARPTATPQEIVRAAVAAGADDFIRAQPRGYDTPVGERGMKLSGGERQRVSLARCFLKDAPILILDEPTSAVDTQTERGIMDSIDRLASGRTTFIIAHRLSTLARCDRILRVADGTVTEVPRESVLDPAELTPPSAQSG